VEIVEKYNRTTQATDDSIIWSMRYACWITKTKNKHTHPEYVTVIASQLMNFFRFHNMF